LAGCEKHAECFLFDETVPIKAVEIIVENC
jgi:hypothetical protein